MKNQAILRKFLSPVKRTRVIEEILGKMRTLLESGQLAVGSKLPPERELCNLLAVSRPSLREALKVLEILGVIRTRQGDGTYISGSFARILSDPQKVRMIDQRASLLEVLEARRVIEPSLAALAATRASDQDLIAMEAAVDGLCLKADFQQHQRYDERFHRAIMRAANNPLLSQMTEIIHDSLLEIFRTTDHVTEDMDKSNDNHRKVFQAIQAKDPVRAKKAMLAVLKQTEKDLLKGEKRRIFQL
jgi:GntR family transcriptional repressor for pyruvate dehydrogenase complex